MRYLDNCKFLFPDSPNLILVSGKEPSQAPRTVAQDYMRVIDLSPEAPYRVNSPAGIIAEGKSSKGPGTALVLLFHQTQTMVQEKLEKKQDECKELAGNVRARLKEAEMESEEVLKELERRLAKRAHIVAETWRLKELSKVCDAVEEFEKKLLTVAKRRLEEGAGLSRDQLEKASRELLPGLFNLLPESGRSRKSSSTSTLFEEGPETELIQQAAKELASPGSMLVVARNIVIGDDGSRVQASVQQQIPTICATCTPPRTPERVKEPDFVTTEAPKLDEMSNSEDEGASLHGVEVVEEVLVPQPSSPAELEGMAAVENEQHSDTPLLEREDSSDVSIHTIDVSREYDIISMDEEIPSPGSDELAAIERQFQAYKPGKSWKISFASIIPGRQAS